MNRVVLFGGTFDPPHIGHLVMATLALEQAGSAQVWLLPAATPPHKISVSPYELRSEMVSRLISGVQGLELCDIEAERRDVPSYTTDTVRILQTQHPNVEFVWLLGADSLGDLPGWHESRELTERISFLVAARTGWPFGSTLERIRQELPSLRADLLQMPILDVSSTFIRTRLEQGRSTCGLVPDSVLAVWRTHWK